MLKIALFEDNLAKTMMVHRSIENEDHEVVAQARTIKESFTLLGSMASHEIEVDVLLLDGQFGVRIPTMKSDMPAFEYTLPESFNETTQKGLFRKKTISTPKVIRVESSDYVNERARDAKAIKEVLMQLGSFGILATPTTIGISSEYLTDHGVEVDYDISSYSLGELPSVLAKIESEKT